MGGKDPRAVAELLFLKVSSAKRKVHIGREKATKGNVHFGGEKKLKEKFLTAEKRN